MLLAIITTRGTEVEIFAVNDQAHPISRIEVTSDHYPTLELTAKHELPLIHSEIIAPLRRQFGISAKFIPRKKEDETIVIDVVQCTTLDAIIVGDNRPFQLSIPVEKIMVRSDMKLLHSGLPFDSLDQWLQTTLEGVCPYNSSFTLSIDPELFNNYIVNVNAELQLNHTNSKLALGLRADVDEELCRFVISTKLCGMHQIIFSSSDSWFKEYIDILHTLFSKRDTNDCIYLEQDLLTHILESTLRKDEIESVEVLPKRINIKVTDIGELSIILRNLELTKIIDIVYRLKGQSLSKLIAPIISTLFPPIVMDE